MEGLKIKEIKEEFDLGRKKFVDYKKERFYRKKERLGVGFKERLKIGEIGESRYI